jgi:hypothetical protein
VPGDYHKNAQVGEEAERADAQEPHRPRDGGHQPVDPIAIQRGNGRAVACRRSRIMIREVQRWLLVMSDNYFVAPRMAPCPTAMSRRISLIATLLARHFRSVRTKVLSERQWSCANVVLLILRCATPMRASYAVT